MWWKILIGVVIAIILLTAIAMYATRNAVGVAEEFVNFIAEGNVDAAYELFSSEAKQVIDKEQFRKSLGASKLNPGVSWQSRSTESTARGTLANAEGTITWAEGGSSWISFTLIKEGEEWKILNFETKRIQ